MSFAFCDYIMEKMFKDILSVLSLVYLVFVSYTLCVECWDTNFQTSVHGISEIQDFDYCHNSGSVIVNYYSCIIPFVRLPVNRITKTFPSVTIVNWACRAECYVEASNLKIEVRGCTAGEYRFLMFQLYFI